MLGLAQHTRHLRSAKALAKHWHLPHLMLASVMFLASGIICALPTAAQDDRLDLSCAPELLVHSTNPLIFPSRSSYSCSEGPQGDAVIKWKSANPSGWDDRIPMMELQEGLLFVRYDDSLQALDVDTGEPVWGAVIGSDSQLFMADRGVVVLGRPEGGMAANLLELRDVREGTVLWSIELPPAQASGVVHGVDDKLVYLYQHPEDLTHWEFRAYSAVDGSEMWRRHFTIHVRDGGWRNPRTLPTREFLYTNYEADSNTDSILALDIDDGTVAWEHRAAGANVIYTEFIRIGDEDALLIRELPDNDTMVFRALERSTGEAAWSIEAPSGLPWMRSETQFYVLTGEAEVRAYDSMTGKEQWRIDLGHKITNGLVYDGRIYALLDGRDVVSLDTETGQDQREEFGGCDEASLAATTAGVTCAPGISIVTPSEVWVIDSNKTGGGSTGDIQVLTPGDSPNGGEAFHHNPDSSFGYPVIVSDGVILAAYTDHVIAIGGDEGLFAVEPSLLPAGEGLDAGSTATVVDDDVVLRGAPAPSGVELSTLEKGTSVELLDGPLEENGDIWWQVMEPESGNTGYVPASSLAAILE